MEEEPPDSPPDRRSAVADELRAIPQSVRQMLGIPAIVPDVLDAIIATLFDILEDAGDRTWDVRLERMPARFEKIFPEGIPDEPLSPFTDMGEEQMKAEFARYFARFRTGAGQRFLRRLLGSMRFHRLSVAFNEDAALVLLGIRRFLRSSMPIAQALEDAVVPLSAKERASLAALNETQTVLLSGTLQLDTLIGTFFEKRDMNLSSLGFPVRNTEATTLDVDLDALSETMRVMLDVEAQRRAGELSEVLLRKLRGFEQALATSDDGISQAATSLVEFIDRLLRTAFTQTEVLTWASAHFPGDKKLAFEKDGVVRPTKRATALCFAYAGQAPMENSTLEPMVALSLVRVRDAAEKLKHADRGTAAEEEELRLLMRAMRGALTFIIRFSWLLAADSRYERLQERFMAQAA